MYVINHNYIIIYLYYNGMHTTSAVLSIHSATPFCRTVCYATLYRHIGSGLQFGHSPSRYGGGQLCPGTYVVLGELNLSAWTYMSAKVTTMQTCVFIKSSNLSNQSEEYVFNISVLWAILWNSSAKDIYDYIKLTNVLVQNSVFY